MCGIQSFSALPDDPTFNQKDNKYNVASYERICGDFGIDPNSDFRFKRGANHGLGKVFIYVTRAGPVATGMSYPSDKAKFSDEGGNASDGNAAYFIRNDDGATKQFEHFVPNHAQGLTPEGLARINQSIEAFCYCILGAQADSRTSILGSDGSNRNTQKDFRELIEDAIINTDPAKSTTRYQTVIDKTKTRLDFAVARRAWLMPSRMIINTESIVGNNNYLVTAKESEGV